MTARARVRYLWLPALLLLWTLIAWQRYTAPAPYHGPVHVLDSVERVG